MLSKYKSDIFLVSHLRLKICVHIPMSILTGSSFLALHANFAFAWENWCLSNQHQSEIELHGKWVCTLRKPNAIQRTTIKTHTTVQLWVKKWSYIYIYHRSRRGNNKPNICIHIQYSIAHSQSQSLCKCNTGIKKIPTRIKGILKRTLLETIYASIRHYVEMQIQSWHQIFSGKSKKGLLISM